MLIPLAAAVMLTAASLGAGAIVLRTIGLAQDTDGADSRIGLAFAVGFGTVGWVFFWLGAAGAFSPLAAWALCLPLAGGMALLRPLHLPRASVDVWTRILAALIFLAFAADLLEALAPPVEADSLAYHFQLPRRFAEAGELFFVPRILDGAVPLLVHMTYTAALLLGDGSETALTLWSLVSGWGASLVLFALARRWLGVNWSLALCLLFQTLPAMLYGAGAGAVEARLALFVLIAAVGLVRITETGTRAAYLLAGIGAGFFVGGKYTGLLFAAATLITVAVTTWTKRSFRPKGVAIFIAAAVIAGGQWYLWNFLHTGDPLFPVLSGLLGFPHPEIWDADYAAGFKNYMAVRHGQITFTERWLIYPIAATFFPAPAMEAGRVGLGPFFMLIAPFAAAGLWRHRRRLAASPLLPVAVCVVVFYLLWLAFGGIPKVRHLVPVVPVVLLCLAAPAKRLVNAGSALVVPVGLAFVAALGINMAALALFSLPYAKYVFSPETRERFLAENVSGFEAARRLNAEPGVRRVMVMNRHFQFYIDAPSFFAFPHRQKRVETRPGHVAPTRLAGQLLDAQITHLLSDIPTSASLGRRSMDTAIPALAAVGCLRSVSEFETPWHLSRTLPTLSAGTIRWGIWKIDAANCAQAAGR